METAQEQRKEEMRGNSISEVLGGLRRKLEEEKNQEDRRTIKLQKKIQDLKNTSTRAQGEHTVRYMWSY